MLQSEVSPLNHRVLAVALAFCATAGLAAIVLFGVERSGPVLTARDGAVRRVDPYCALPPKDFEVRPQLARTGTFDAALYGYALKIPPGLTAYVSPASPSQGFGIVLSRSPRAFVRVQAVYDVFYDITAAGVHLRDAGGVRLHDTLLSDVAQPFALDGTSGGRYRMRVQCPGDPQVYMNDDIIVVRNREIYRLALESPPTRYAQDVRILESLAQSWRWVPVPAAQ